MSRFRTRMDAIRAGADDQVPPRGPNGRIMCWNCRAVEIPPRRQAYCSNACAEESDIKNIPAVARARVFERDHGVCARCGLDTVYLKRVGDWLYWRTFRRWHFTVDATGRHPGLDASGWIDERAATALNSLSLEFYGRPWDHGRWSVPFTGHLWEMDHIIPVVEGGGQCGLENLRTLCIPCHRQVTRELRARLAGKAHADSSLQPALFESAA